MRDADADVPLVVDLDGTLAKVDTLHEAFADLAFKRPSSALRALGRLTDGRAGFKSLVADHALAQPHSCPLDQDVLKLIEAAKAEGRRVYIATASDARVASSLAEALPQVDGVFGSDDVTNLKGRAKADLLVKTFGAGRFDYVGNSTADIPVWRVARNALVAGCSPAKYRRLRKHIPSLLSLRDVKFPFSRYLSALRPHQWLKNGLIALPAVAAHDFGIPSLIAVALAIIAFSLAASSIYLANDIVDLSSDRAHPKKQFRAIAAGDIPIAHALVLSVITAGVAIGLGLLLRWPFVLVLLGYLALSTTYSLYLKRKLMIDVVALASLYGTRVLAGGAVTSIVLSKWLVAFCFFMFLSLALVKRAAEMIALPSNVSGRIQGRGYRREDLQVIPSLMAASGFLAILILALYINAPEITALYSRPDLLWGVCLILTYWLGRVYFLTGRGEMHHDPVVFAATDWISLACGGLITIVFAAAL